MHCNVLETLSFRKRSSACALGRLLSDLYFYSWIHSSSSQKIWTWWAYVKISDILKYFVLSWVIAGTEKSTEVCQAQQAAVIKKRLRAQTWDPILLLWVAMWMEKEETELKTSWRANTHRSELLILVVLTREKQGSYKKTSTQETSVHLCALFVLWNWSSMKHCCIFFLIPLLEHQDGKLLHK